MPKNFRKLPIKLSEKLKAIKGDAVEVRSLVRLNNLEIGSFIHLGVTSENLSVGNSWEIIPPSYGGITSKRNIEGWKVKRIDLPKYKKVYCHEIENFGDGSKFGYSTVCIEREVCHVDHFPPPDLSIRVSVDEMAVDGSFGISFTISDQLPKSQENFDDDILFAVNLLQENVGTVDIVQPESARAYFTQELNWEIFPPGDVGNIIKTLRDSRKITAPESEEVARKRLEMFERFQPVNYLSGFGGSNSYIGAKYADDLVVFENIKAGNALYVMYADWELQSKRSRSDLLRLSGDKFDRILHTKGWEEVFIELMKFQLKKRRLSLMRR